MAGRTVELDERTYREIWLRLRMMKAYVFGHYDHDELFSVLLKSLNHLERRLGGLKKLIGQTLSEEDSRQLQDVARCVQLCQGYFSDACQLCFRGSSADLFSSHHVGHGFASSAHLSMKALNYLAEQTIANVRPDKEWEGFALFSESLSYEAALGEIIVQPFAMGNVIEFVHDWLIMSHELGHIYYWGKDGHLLKTDFYLRAGPYLPSLLAEYLADMFGLIVGYYNNPIVYVLDFDRVRTHYQSAKSTRLYADTYSLRKFFVIAFYLFSRNQPLANVFLKIARQEACDMHDKTFADVGVLAEESLRNEYGDLYEAIVEPGRAAGKNTFRALFVTGAETEIWRARGAEHRRNIVRMTIKLAAVLALKTSVDPSLLPPEKQEYDKSEYAKHVDGLLQGHVVDETIGQPFALLYELAYRCYLEGIDLDQPERSNTRAAAILSLCQGK